MKSPGFSSASRMQRRQRGLALVAVLWVVAALSLTVTGAAYLVRNEIRATSDLRERVVKGALNDAAIAIAARELAAPQDPGKPLLHVDAEFDGQTIGVEVIALTGLIDLNSAGENLLAALFATAGGADAPTATALAQRVLDWREPGEQPRPHGAKTAAYVEADSPFRPRLGPFEAPEDLLQVLGVDYDLYRKVKNLVTVHLPGGNGQVEPLYAPAPVLQVLAGASPQLATDYESARQTDGARADTTRFPAEYVGRRASPRFLLEAAEGLSSGARLVTRTVVDMSLKPEGRPWTVIWSERSVEAVKAQ